MPFEVKDVASSPFVIYTGVGSSATANIAPTSVDEAISSTDELISPKPDMTEVPHSVVTTAMPVTEEDIPHHAQVKVSGTDQEYYAPDIIAEAVKDELKETLGVHPSDLDMRRLKRYVRKARTERLRRRNRILLLGTAVLALAAVVLSTNNPLRPTIEDSVQTIAEKYKGRDGSKAKNRTVDEVAMPSTPLAPEITTPTTTTTPPSIEPVVTPKTTIAPVTTIATVAPTTTPTAIYRNQHQRNISKPYIFQMNGEKISDIVAKLRKELGEDWDAATLQSAVPNIRDGYIGSIRVNDCPNENARLVKLGDTPERYLKLGMTMSTLTYFNKGPIEYTPSICLQDKPDVKQGSSATAGSK